MSYLRGRFYVWSDGDLLHLWVRDADDDDTSLARDALFAGQAGIAIPVHIFDRIVRLRMREPDFDASIPEDY